MVSMLMITQIWGKDYTDYSPKDESPPEDGSVLLAVGLNQSLWLTAEVLHLLSSCSSQIKNHNEYPGQNRSQRY